MKTERAWAFGPSIFRKTSFLTLLMVSIALVFVACSKDDDEDESLLYLEGSPHFSLPMYAMTGEILEVTASGVVTEGVSYTWAFGSLDSISVSGAGKETIRLRVPDSIATYTVSVTANAGDEYYGSVYSMTMMSIGKESLTGVEAPQKVFTDPRDGMEYGIVEIGNLQWFSNNLNWKGAGQGYGKTDAGAYVFGRLYTWNDATGGVSASGLGNGVQGVCPQGWSIPTNEDWIDLAMALNGGQQVTFTEDWKDIAGKLMVDAKFNGEKVWPYSPLVNITNEYGWNALAGGSSSNNYNNYANVLSYGFWWSCSERDSNNGYYKYIFNEYPHVSAAFSAKDGMGASVRCVRLK